MIFFLWGEQEAFVKNNDLIKSNIYIPQYSQEKKLFRAKGSIINRNKYEFTYLSDKEHGSLGSPIFLFIFIDVIGINKESNKDKADNLVIFYILYLI